MKLHEIFEKVVQENPHEIAVRFQEKSYTYQQINEEVNKLSNYLNNKLHNKTVKQPVVGVYLTSSENPLIAMLAISKLGGIYLPLSPGAEAANLETICKNTPPHIVIHEKRLNLDKLNLSEECTQICLDDEEVLSEIGACNQDNLTPITTPDEELIAYYIYSSGTTGAPKCIPIAHRGLGKWSEKLKTLDDGSKRAILSHIPISFDAHIWEHLMAWSLHAPVCIADDSLRGNKDPAGLAKFIAKHNISDVTIVPTILNPIIKLENDEFACKNNKLNIYCTGEAISRELVEACLNLGWEFYECYGPTEATFGFTIDQIKYLISAGKKSAESFASFIIQNSKFEGFDSVEDVLCNDIPPIGKPYSDEIEVFILDEDNQVITDGRPGQLAYHSPDMTKGYLNNEEDNNKKFAEIKIPGREKSLRVHLTGDMFAQQGDNFYCLGRIGSSAKISGTLLEGKGIEETLRKINGVLDVTVIKVFGNPERIVGIYTANSDTITPEAIRKELKNTFEKPVPIILRKIDRMPTLDSGKINQRELEKIAKETKRDTPSILKPPTTQLQKELVTLWTSLLQDRGIEEKDIQISDDFSFLGGNSSDRNLLWGEIKKRYSIELDAATLWDDDFNIENLANLIEYEKFKPIILKNPDINNKNPPFFLFPSITGDGPSEYGKLSVELKKSGVEQSVYAFKAPGLIDSSYAQLTIQQLVEHYYKQLKKTQPKGPYYLGGWSSGALIAYGVAQKLKENGDDVRYLALIDEVAPPKNQNSYQQENFANELLELIKHLPANLSSSIIPKDLSNKSCKDQVEHVFELLIPKKDPINAKQTLDVVKSFLLGILVHEFKPINLADDIHVFYTNKTLQDNGNKNELGWEQYGNVTAYPAGDNHFSPIAQPKNLATEIAKQIKSQEHSDHEEILKGPIRRESDGASSSSSNSSSSPRLDALTAVNATIQNAIYISLKTPCNVLTVLQLLQRLIEWYILALVKLSSYDNNTRSELIDNEEMFNKAVLSIINELRTRAIPNDQTTPAWLKTWLSDVETFAKQKVTTMAPVTLLDHCLSLKKFSQSTNTQNLKTLSNQNNTFSTALSKAEDAINELDDAPTEILPITPKQDATKPLYNALVNHADSFAAKIKKKKTDEFHYSNNDFMFRI